MRIWLVLPIILLSTLMTGSAKSEAAPCSPETLDNFDVRGADGRRIWDVPDIACVEFFRYSFSTPHGERYVRAIGDVNADTFMPAGGLAAVEAGMRSVTARINDLGDYKIPNITILVTEISPDEDSLVDVSDDGGWEHSTIAADASPAAMSAEGECPVRLFTLNEMNATDMKQALAHEIFHCVQFGSLSPAQIDGAAPWWIEGSADMFSNYIFPHMSDLFRREPHFDDAVNASTPINDMAYESVFLFLWYNEQTGITGLLPLLRSMATSPDAAAQRRVLGSMLAPEQWLEFAQAYDAGEIRYPDGVPARFGRPPEGDTWTISTTSTKTKTMRPYVISPGWVNYECGLWGNRLSPGTALMGLRVDGAGAWMNYPSETDCRERRSIRYRSMIMYSGTSNANLSMRAERRIACENCLGSDSVIDRCMVGTWQQTGGGPVEWMRRNGVPITNDNVGRVRVTMRDDGTVMTEQIGIDMEITVRDRDGPIVNQSNGRINGIAGRWSAESGRLRMCVDSGGQASGNTRTSYPNGMSASSPFAFSAGTGGGSSYTCTATTLRTVIAMPRGGDMVHEFTRVTPPPPGLR